MKEACFGQGCYQRRCRCDYRFITAYHGIHQRCQLGLLLDRITVNELSQVCCNFGLFNRRNTDCACIGFHITAREQIQFHRQTIHMFTGLVAFLKIRAAASIEKCQVLLFTALELCVLAFDR